ncbi:MAG TPA: hypothetical protein VL984_07220 [Acidimicrobiales bacterium]|nr:hypothetical protein [Acidimicrobiales bacterium]
MRRRGRRQRAPKMLAAAAVLTAGALAAGLAVNSAPAYADVTSSNYTIGAPSGAVSGVLVTPSAVSKSQSTNFQVSFTVGNALSGGADDWVSVAVNGLPLSAAPTNIDLVGSSCIQSGTSGAGGAGTSATTLLTVELGTSCNLASGTTAQLDFTAGAPGSLGTFSFSVSTSRNSTAAQSGNVTVNNAGPTLTAALSSFGANTTYTITGVTVAGLSSSTTSLVLTAIPTAGSETLSFLNATAGYAVTFTPSGGSATSDTVESATSIGASVTLSLGTALVNGDTLALTATGTNPATSSSTVSDEVSVQPGNGTTETTNSVTFGGSVTDLTVSPASTIAGANTVYTVSFEAADAAAAGGSISFSETTGPTNFSTVSGIEVIDSTQNWHFVATGSVLGDGTATIPLSYAISAHDSVTVIAAGVTNPSNTGTITDFEVTTSGDPVAAYAPAYPIGANGSPGVLVTVSPPSTGVTATYAITNVVASSALAGGSGTIELEAPAGTVFPNNSSFFTVSDATTPTGSGTASGTLSGGGTNNVTFTVPNTVNSGDKLTITVSDVLNPTSASSTYTITLVGGVTGLAPTVPTTTTTTTAPTTTTTTTKKPPAPKPVVADLTTSATVSKRAVHVKLRCTVVACKGTISLVDVVTRIGGNNYTAKAGKTVTIGIGLNSKGVSYLKGAKHHTIKVWATVTVNGGKTIKTRLTLTE